MNATAAQLQRMLALIPFLRANPGTTVEEVADRFSIPVSKARREVFQLMMTGTGWTHEHLIDLDMDAFEQDVIHISNTEFMPRPLRVSGTEGVALVVALEMLRQLATPEQTEVIEQLTTKLQAALSGSSAPTIDVHVEAGEETTRRALTRALDAGEQVRISYVSEHSDSESERTVDPLGLVKHAGHLYLSAWCHLSEGHRIFRLDRIAEAKELGTPVTDTTPQHPVDGGLFSFEIESEPVLLEVDPTSWWIVEPLSHRVLAKDEAGTRTVELLGTGSDWLKRLVLLSGGEIRVVEPAELRDVTRHAAEAALSAYDGLKFPN